MEPFKKICLRDDNNLIKPIKFNWLNAVVELFVGFVYTAQVYKKFLKLKLNSIWTKDRKKKMNKYNR